MKKGLVVGGILLATLMGIWGFAPMFGAMTNKTISLFPYGRKINTAVQERIPEDIRGPIFEVTYQPGPDGYIIVISNLKFEGEAWSEDVALDYSTAFLLDVAAACERETEVSVLCCYYRVEGAGQSRTATLEYHVNQDMFYLMKMHPDEQITFPSPH